MESPARRLREQEDGPEVRNSALSRAHLAGEVVQSLVTGLFVPQPLLLYYVMLCASRFANSNVA